MAILCVLLAVVCVFDYRKGKIPNLLTAAILFTGIVWRFGRDGPCDIFACLCGMLLAAGILYPFFKIGALGAGDIKLFGATAAFLPFHKIVLFLLMSLLIAAVISFIQLWKEKKFGERFGYLFRYLSDTWKSGRPGLYTGNGEDDRRQGICLSGPALVGVLLYLGGIY